MTLQIEQLWKGCLDALFPRVCPVCSKIISQDLKRSRKICPKCYEKLSFVEDPFCRICGRGLSDDTKGSCENCKKHQFSFDYGLVLLDYNEETRNSMAGIKYKGHREYLEFYGEETAKRLGNEILSMKPDALIPVPVHRKRRIQRGYNQAEVLAQVIGKELSIPVLPHALKRRGSTKALKELGADQRKKNLSHAMYPGKVPAGLRTAIIVDDIFTTGATMETCARILKENGVEHVYSLCLCAKRG